jgi:hypothetical protein
MAEAHVQLELYVAIIDYLTDRHLSDTESHTWVEIVNDWARDVQDLDDEEREYFMSGILRLGGDRLKGGDWELRPRNPDLDPLVWTFHRAWTDMHGYLYPPQR